MHPHSKENQVVTAQAYIINCYLHTPISCKFLLKFTHNLLVVNCDRNLIAQSSFRHEYMAFHGSIGHLIIEIILSALLYLRLNQKLSLKKSKKDIFAQAP